MSERFQEGMSVRQRLQAILRKKEASPIITTQKTNEDGMRSKRRSHDGSFSFRVVREPRGTHHPLLQNKKAHRFT